MNRQTQRFSGKTLETAVLSAINDLGEDAEILDARRVRRGGVAGFFASEHYVVTARESGRRAAVADEPAPRRLDPDPVAVRPAPTAGFEAHLRQLVTAVEAQEQAADLVRPAAVPRRPVPVAPAPTGRVSPLPRFFTDDDLTPIAPPRPRPVTAPAFVAPFAPEPEEAAAPQRQPVHAAAGRRQPAAPPVEAPAPEPTGPAWQPWTPGSAGGTATATAVAPAPAPAAVVTADPATGDAVIDLRGGDGGPRWSMENLRALGVPEAVLAQLPEGLRGDVAWTAALERTIRRMVSAPDPRSADAAMAVSGAATAAPRLLEAALAGFPLGELHLGDRRVPATAFELTLAIRACLRS